MSAESGRHWTEEVLGDEMTTHEVEPETFCRVHYHCDGSATFDEGWGGAWIESDTLYQLEAWR
jgi:hypothetical protein